MPRNDIKKGDFIIGGACAADPPAKADPRAKIKKGAFLTIDCPAPRSQNLTSKFPEFENVLEAAGPVPSAADLAKHWERQAELEAQLADLQRRAADVKAGVANAKRK
jgi:hypothetical protein